MLVIHLAVHISSAGYSLAVKHDDIGTCNFSYAPQHSYSTLDLSYQNIDTHGIWYVDGDVMFSGSTIAEFTSQTSQTLGSRLRTYFTGGGKWQRNISGGLQPTTWGGHHADCQLSTPIAPVQKTRCSTET